MNHITIALAFLLVAFLSACGDPNERPRTVSDDTTALPVLTPCADKRPEPVKALNETMTRAQFDALTVKQQAAAVAAQTLKRRSYGEALDAATKGCPEAKVE